MNAPLRDDGDSLNAALDRLEGAPWDFDFFQVLRRLECLQAEGKDVPGLGSSSDPSQDVVRLGQEASLSFSPSTLARVDRLAAGKRRLMVSFLGLLGPNGPLPHHLSEYARQRERNFHDPAFARFLDLFHHRLLSFFYRAWANSQQTVGLERGGGEAFKRYVGSLVGLGMPELWDRDELLDDTKLHYAGRLATQVGSREGLEDLLRDYFGIPVEIEEYAGCWIELTPAQQCRLGGDPSTAALGMTAVAGTRVWDCQSRYRIRVGPLPIDEFSRFLPSEGASNAGPGSLDKLRAWLRNYVGDELGADLQLVLQREDVPGVVMPRAGDDATSSGGPRLGWTTWIKTDAFTRDPDDVVITVLE